jgi:SET domain-containing protein
VKFHDFTTSCSTYRLISLNYLRNILESSLTNRFVNHDSLSPNVRVEVIYHEITARDYRSKGKKNQNNFKLHVNTKENDETESLESLALVKEESSRKKKADLLYSLNSPRKGFEIRMSALRRILEGEELCFDYGPLYSPAAGWAM